MFYTKESKAIYKVTEPCLSCEEMYQIEMNTTDDYWLEERCDEENCPYEKSGCICKRDMYREGDVCIVNGKRFIHNGIAWILDGE